MTLQAVHLAHLAVSATTKITITNSMTGHQFYFALEGCSPGRQHYRCCTPHALKAPADLLCPFCKGGTYEWMLHKKCSIPTSELAIMHMLARMQLDTLFSWQVMVDFWAACVDLKCISHPIVIQADGSCHFKRMYDSTTGKQLHDDLRFCAAAYKSGCSVVRVHELQIGDQHSTAFLSAALSVASSTQCIVLSPGYTMVCMYEPGRFVTYAQLLCDMLPGTTTMRDACSNTIIRPA